MSIKYYLQPNHLTPNPNDQTARVVIGTAHDIKSIIKLMLARGSTITEADALAVITLFMDVVEDEVINGNSVNVSLLKLRPVIGGVFTDAADSFDASRHAKRISMRPGVSLAKKTQTAKVEKVIHPLPTPLLLQFTDIKSQTINSVLSPGGIGKLIGDELKFNPSNPEEGIFFVGDGGITVKAEVVANRTEGKLIFSIPHSMSTGFYSLEVRKGYGSASVNLRSGSLVNLLKVS